MERAGWDEHGSRSGAPLPIRRHRSSSTAGWVCCSPGKDGHRSVLSFQVDGGRIVRIDVVRNPEKLRRVGPRPG